MREYMRVRRLGFAQGSPQRPDTPFPKKVSPKGTNGGTNSIVGHPHTYKRKHRVSPSADLWGERQPDRVKMYPLHRRHLIPYMAYLADRGGTLLALDLGSGELLETPSRGQPVAYILTPIVPGISTAVGRLQVGLAAALKRITQLEAGAVLHEAQEAYTPFSTPT